MNIWVDGSGYNGICSKFAVYTEEGKLTLEKFQDRKDSFETELLAMSLALEMASDGDVILSDSQQVVRFVTERTLPDCPEKYRQIFAIAKKNYKMKNVQVKWVSREQNKAGKILSSENVREHRGQG